MMKLCARDQPLLLLFLLLHPDDAADASTHSGAAGQKAGYIPRAKGRNGRVTFAERRLDLDPHVGDPLLAGQNAATAVERQGIELAEAAVRAHVVVVEQDRVT